MSSARYFVPDLSPLDRPELEGLKFKRIFVAESPHVSEVAPERRSDRRPLCGAAGRQWWSALSDILEGEPNEDVSLERMLKLCRKNGIVVLNAVQKPMDSKIAKTVPEADPLRTLHFDKGPGSHSYKKLKGGTDVKAALDALSERLRDPRLAALPIHCLGNDAEWFVERALGKDEARARVGDKIPHPSAWWRKGGFFGRIARERLSTIFKAN